MIMKENDIYNFVAANSQPGEMPLVGVSANTINYKNLVVSVAGTSFGGAIGGAIAGSSAGPGVVQCLLLANNIRFVILFFGPWGSQPKEIMTISRNDIEGIEVKKILFGQKINMKLKNNTECSFNLSNSMMGQPNHKQRLSELLNLLSNQNSVIV